MSDLTMQLDVSDGPVKVPSEAWSLIDERLWQGGNVACPTTRRFDEVLTLSKSTFEQAPAGDGVVEHCWFFDDGPMPSGAEVERWARYLNGVRAEGGRVLVRCQAGLNRSGLVVAAMLIQQGMTASEAIVRVRNRRAAQALFNRAFLGWLLTHHHPDG